MFNPKEVNFYVEDKKIFTIFFAFILVVLMSLPQTIYSLTRPLLTYEDKYIGGSKKSGPSKGMASASRKIPAEIGTKLTNEVKDVAVKAFKALNLSGDVRIDFLIDSKKKNVYINEVNTIPGSLAFYLWEPIGKDYTELLDELINIAVKDYKKRINKTHSFDSNILSGFTGGIKGCKGCKGVKSLK